MWAGSQFEFHRPLRVGDAVTRVSTIDSVSEKSGRTGPLVFVKVRHEIRRGGEKDVALTEFHDIVYREAPKPDDPPVASQRAPSQSMWAKEWVPDDVLLFRYSALTFNGHRIHYDLDYVKNEEHYPGLIVHGPLQTTLLLDLCRRHAPRPVKKLDYRAMYPVFHTERFTVNGNPSADGATAEVWTANAAGNQAMAGVAHF
jgi:3-methylfumaryl-CoA hydratase